MAMHISVCDVEEQKLMSLRMLIEIVSSVQRDRHESPQSFDGCVSVLIGS